MAESSNQRAEYLASDDDEQLDAETQLALEFKDVLRELASDLATSVASPSVSGVAEAVRSEVSALGKQLRESLEQEVAGLRAEQAALLDAVRTEIEMMRSQTTAELVSSMKEAFSSGQARLVGALDTRLAPVEKQVDSLRQLEDHLREQARSTSEAATSAATAIRSQIDTFIKTGDSLKNALSSTAKQLGDQANDLRNSVSSVIPSLDAAARSVETSQEGLKGMLRTYNDTLDRSLTALETKFAGILAANLERVTQRQAELETRVRGTAERTEEAVVDLMQGNEAHHQAMVESTAASLSQLEMFSKSFKRTSSALNGLFYLSAGVVAGLTFVCYLLLASK